MDTDLPQMDTDDYNKGIKKECGSKTLRDWDKKGLFHIGERYMELSKSYLCSSVLLQAFV